MAGYKCPFCKEISALPSKILHEGGIPHTDPITNQIMHIFRYYVYRCANPECNRYALEIEGIAREVEGYRKFIWPESSHNIYPEYVPYAIRNDYEEACAIVDLSAKASATLSRRCLQGMIRDFHKINEANLHQEILKLRGIVDDSLLQALLSLKSIGNIGAHPETDVMLMVDVEPEEARQLILLIEFLIEEWYIARENRKGLIAKVNEISEVKKNLQLNSGQSRK